MDGVTSRAVPIVTQSVQHR